MRRKKREEKSKGSRDKKHGRILKISRAENRRVGPKKLLNCREKRHRRKRNCSTARSDLSNDAFREAEMRAINRISRKVVLRETEKKNPATANKVRLPHYGGRRLLAEASRDRGEYFSTTGRGTTSRKGPR